MQIFLAATLVACVASAPHEHKQADADPNVASLAALKPKPVKKWHIQPSGVVTKTESSGLARQLQKIKQDMGGPMGGPMGGHSLDMGGHLGDMGEHSHVSQLTRNQFSKNGHLVGSLSHSMESRTNPGEKPHKSSVTELEVPSLGIHERMTNRDGEKDKTADPETAAELAGYILETGDQASVVQFLQMLLQEGKMSDEQALAYVETIKKEIEATEQREREEERENQREVEREKERERERERAQEAPRDDLEKIRKLVDAEERAQEERAFLEKARSLKETTSNMEKDDDEHDLILRINDYLEGSLKEGKISKNLYNHMKEALIESVVESLRDDTGALAGMDYGHY